MGNSGWIITALTLASLVGATGRWDAAAEARGAAAPASGPVDTVDREVERQVLADINFEGNAVSLEDFTQYLRERVKGFQAVTAGDPSVWRQLSLPGIHLKNVRLGQVLQLLQDVFPGLQ